MRWPWSKEERVIEYQPEEYTSPEDAWEYVAQLDREADAWRHARGASKKGLLEGASLGSTSIRYTSGGFRGAYKDFLEEYSDAYTDDGRMKVFNKYVRSMMARRWTRKGAISRLIQVLIAHGLIEGEDTEEEYQGVN